MEFDVLTSVAESVGIVLGLFNLYISWHKVKKLIQKRKTASSPSRHSKHPIKRKP